MQKTHTLVLIRSFVLNHLYYRWGLLERPLQSIESLFESFSRTFTPLTSLFNWFRGLINDAARLLRTISAFPSRIIATITAAPRTPSARLTLFFYCILCIVSNIFFCFSLYSRVRLPGLPWLNDKWKQFLELREKIRAQCI